MKRTSRNRALEGIDPASPFYLTVTIGNLDGSRCDLGGEGFEGEFDNEAEAIEHLRDINGDYPTLDGWVYHCIPVAKIWRGKIRVSRLAATAARAQTGEGE